MPTGRGSRGCGFPVVSIQPRLTQVFVVKMRPIVGWPSNTLVSNCIEETVSPSEVWLAVGLSSGSGAHGGA